MNAAWPEQGTEGPPTSGDVGACLRTDDPRRVTPQKVQDRIVSPVTSDRIARGKVVMKGLVGSSRGKPDA